MNLKNWLFEGRSWTKKTYSSITSGKVRIYDKATSPVSMAGAWAVALAILGLFAAGVYQATISPPPSTLEWVSLVISLAIWSLPTALTIGGINKGLRSWHRRHFQETHCDHCGVATTYEYVFDEHYDLGQHRTHHFCSSDCREEWERENIDYEFSGYYDIQSEDDEEKVEMENYSSAYYVEGEATLQTE